MSESRARKFRQLVRQWQTTNFDPINTPIELKWYEGKVTQRDFNRAILRGIRADYGQLPRYRWRMTKGLADYRKAQ